MLMLGGAEVILTPSACGLDTDRLGHSVAFSGIRFDRAGNALDHKLVEAGDGEELPIATFDLDAPRAYRA